MLAVDHEVLERALHVVVERGDSAAVAAIQMAIGSDAALSGKPVEARAAFEAAEVAAKQAGLATLEAEAAIQRGQLAFEAEEVGESIACFTRALRSPGLPDDDHARRATVLHNLATSRAFLDAHGPAIGLYRRALEEWNAVEEDHPSQLETLLGLGEALTKHGDAADAAGVLQEALERMERGDREDQALEAAAQELLASALFRCGKAEESMGPTRRARTLWEALGASADLRRVTLGLAELLLGVASLRPVGDEEGPALADEGLSFLRSWIGMAQREGDVAAEVYGWWRLSKALAEVGRRREGVEALVQAATVQEKAGGEGWRPTLARAAQMEVAAVTTAGDASRPGGLDRAVRWYSKLNDQQGTAWCRRQRLHAAVVAEAWEDAAAAISSIRKEEECSEREQGVLLAHLAWVGAMAGNDEEAALYAEEAMGFLGVEGEPLAQILARVVAVLRRVS